MLYAVSQPRPLEIDISFQYSIGDAVNTRLRLDAEEGRAFNTPLEMRIRSRSRPCGSYQRPFNTPLEMQGAP